MPRPFLLGLFLLLAVSVSGAASAGSDLVVDVEGVEKPEGMVRGLLWTKAEGFPSDPEKAVGRAEARAEGTRVTLVFSDVEPGRYAVSVIHDANDNAELDTNFLGIPKEGVGISNNAIGMTGPRDFEEALFDKGPDPLRLSIDFYHW